MARPRARGHRPDTSPRRVADVPVTVALDSGGADLGPAEVARGAVQAVEADPALRVLLYGPAPGIVLHDRSRA